MEADIHNKLKVPELSSFKWFFFVIVFSRETMHILNRYNVFTSNCVWKKKFWKNKCREMWLWHSLHRNECICGFVVDEKKILHNNDESEYSLCNALLITESMNSWTTVNYQTSKAKLLKIHHLKSETFSLINKHRYLHLFKTFNVNYAFEYWTFIHTRQFNKLIVHPKNEHLLKIYSPLGDPRCK